MTTVNQLRKDIISASRILSHLKLVEGFGHVSARIPDSDRFFITPRISLALVSEEQLLTLNLNGEIVEGQPPRALRSLAAHGDHENQAAGQCDHPHPRPRGKYFFGHRPPARAGAQSRQFLRRRRAGIHASRSDLDRRNLATM